MKRILLSILWLSVLASSPAFAAPFGTSFTYQGRLNDSGSPANGTYDFRFILYNADSGGSQVGPTLTNSATSVADGLFTASLDFGTGVFDGTAYWLEVAVRPGASSASFTPLNPRQPLRPAPYALYTSKAGAAASADTASSATSVPWTGLTGVPPGFADGTDNDTTYSAGAGLTLGGTQFAVDFGGSGAASQASRSDHAHSGADITSGTVADARLSANVPRLDAHQTFTGTNTFTGTTIATNGPNLFAGTFSGDGGGLTNLNGAVIANGTIGNSALADGVVTTAKLGAGAVTSAEIADATIGTADLANGAVTSAKINNNSILPADLNLTSFGTTFWQTGGNAGTSPGTHFLGTTDNQPLEFKVNGLRALRLEPGFNPTVIVGSSNNSAGVGAAGSVIGGGSTNQIGANASYSTIGGGSLNLVTNKFGVVPGGTENLAGGAYSYAAGRKAKAVHDGAFVWADSSGADFSSAATNEFAVRATGGARFETGSADFLINGLPVLRASGGNFDQIKPYQAGALSLEPFAPFTSFQSRIVNQPITFAQSFSVPPIITVSLETSERTYPVRISPILVQQKTTSGFSASFNLPNLPVTVSARGSDISRAPITVVNGQPALAYRSGASLYFVRAQDTTGRSWGSPVLVASGDPREIELAVVNGNPAIAFRDSSQNLRYARANDANGVTWAAPVTVQTAASGTFRAADISLAVISGNPAIACFDIDGREIFYFRATDLNGTTWPPSGTLVGTGSGAVSLLEVNGRPAISYGWDNGLGQSQVGYVVQLRYLRASDGLGTSWSGAGVTNITGSNFELIAATDLQIVNSNPAVLFEHSRGGVSPRDWLRFTRAGDVNGTSWGAPVDVSAAMQFVGGHGVGLVTGRPAVVWYDAVAELLRYSESSNLGASFFTLTAFTGVANSLPSVTDVGGRPGLSFSSSQDGELLYMRDGNPIIDTFINWIAVEP